MAIYFVRKLMMEVLIKLNKFNDHLKQSAVMIEKAIDKVLPTENKHPSILHEAMRYSAFAGGKRIRPIMVLEAAKIFGLAPEKAIFTACGIEMIHTYSLIHDDLPLMDDDDFRRGKPTCHKVFGDAIALLAGDALLTNAFTVIAQNAKVEGISAVAVLDVIDKISEAAGSLGMVGGQTVDFESCGKRIDKDTLIYIDTHKTGCLIRASLWSGARLAEAKAQDLDTIDKFGEKLGLIFQIKDDILDVTGDEKVLGKPVGSDEKNLKNTFPQVVGYENSLQIAEKLSKEAKQLLAAYKNNDFFIQLVDFLLNRNY
jgi:geranylgeranyl diphosphate synthase type II